MKRAFLLGLLLAAESAEAETPDLDLANVVTFVRCRENPFVSGNVLCDVIVHGRRPDQCIAFDSDGKPLAAQWFNTNWNSAAFDDLDADEVADVQCIVFE